MCVAAEDELPKKETEPAATLNDNNSHDTTPPKSPSPTPTPTETTPPTTPTKVNGTTHKPSPSPEPKTTTPEPASENINNVKSNNKHVEELYDIPVGK